MTRIWKTGWNFTYIASLGLILRSRTGPLISFRLSFVDIALLLGAPHLRNHDAHSKDDVADTPQLRDLAVERHDALILQGRLEVLRVPKANAKQVLLGMRCLLAQGLRLMYKRSDSQQLRLLVVSLLPLVGSFRSCRALACARGAELQTLKLFPGVRAWRT